MSREIVWTCDACGKKEPTTSEYAPEKWSTDPKTDRDLCEDCDRVLTAKLADARDKFYRTRASHE